MRPVFLSFIFCCLFLCGYSQSYNYESVQDFKNNYSSSYEIEPKTVKLEEANFLRFTELGDIYNPNFPQTRNRVQTESYQLQDNEKLEYMGFSVSTFRATVSQKGKVGTFYTFMRGATCSSLLEYKVEEKDGNLLVTGKIYKCYRAA